MPHGNCQTATPESNQEKKRGHILQKAHEIINGERQDSYGNPEDSFRLIGEYWSNYLKANELMIPDRELIITPIGS